LKLLMRVASEGGQFHRFIHGVLRHLDLGAKVGGFGLVFLDANPPQALDEDADGVVGELEHLEHPGAATEFPQILRLGIVNLRSPLQDEGEEAVALDHIVNEPDALGGVHDQRSDHAGEHHHVGKAEHGQGGRQAFRGWAGGGDAILGGGPQNADEFSVG
jgi:hypothetical protein